MTRNRGVPAASGISFYYIKYDLKYYIYLKIHFQNFPEIRLIDKDIIITYNKSTKKRTDFRANKEDFVMLAVKSMSVRTNFKEWCRKVFNGETIIVSRPKNENVVMVSEKKYNELLKAKRNAEYLAMLDKSLAEAKSGGFIVKSLEELEDYE